MELRTLKYFLTVAREENFTRAAELLHITQPTLSRQLMQLEEEVGAQLFNRLSRKITLTQAGLILRRRAEEIVGLVQKTEKEISRLEEENDQLKEEMALPENATNVAKLMELNTKLEENEAALLELYDKWEELSE